MSKAAKTLQAASFAVVSISAQPLMPLFLAVHIHRLCLTASSSDHGRGHVRVDDLAGLPHRMPLWCS